MPVGAVVSRAELHERFGGSHSRGISAGTGPGRPRQILLWWRPERGGDYGYRDGWTKDGAFYFTGTGQVGDQVFGHPLQENGRLLKHNIEGDLVRLLRYVGVNKVRYVCELRLDEQAPWQWRDELDRLGSVRRAIQFRLMPVGEVYGDGKDEMRESMVAAPEPTVLATPPMPPNVNDIEAVRKPEFIRLLKARELLSSRTEAKLVIALADWLKENRGLLSSGMTIPYTPESRPLRVDMFVPDRRLLVEAKSTTAREAIRLAIGQLLDYRRYFQPVPRVALLTPSRPPVDMLGLLESLDIGALWSSGDGSFETWPRDLL